MWATVLVLIIWMLGGGSVLASGPSHAHVTPPKVSAKGPVRLAKSRVWIEKVRGNITLKRDGKISRVLQEQDLRVGDLLLAWEDSRFRVASTRGEIIDIASHSGIRMESTGIALLFGDARGVVKKSNSFQLHLPTALVQSRDGEFLAHVSRNEPEFRKRLAGEFSELPTFAEMKTLSASPFLYSQVGCVEGSIQVKPRKSDKVLLKSGEIIRIIASTGDFSPFSVGADELRHMRQLLEFFQD